MGRQTTLPCGHRNLSCSLILLLSNLHHARSLLNIAAPPQNAALRGCLRMYFALSLPPNVPRAYAQWPHSATPHGVG